jgi:predicted  nucleic acid-binding Zn-ribbon protein
MNHQDDKDQDQDQDAPKGLSELEESAFYESGLSAHGCIDRLDAYAMESIKRYGCILFNAAYKDATAFKAYKEYTGLMLDSKRLKEELAEIKERCEKLEKAMKYSPSGESLLSKFIQATQDAQVAQEEIGRLKEIIKGDDDAWVELNEELKDTREKLSSVICHENDLMDSVSNLQKEIRLLKAIMNMMKDKANE